MSGLQDSRSGGGSPFQRRAVHRSDRDIHKSLPEPARLVLSCGGECGEIITPLDPALHIEAAETVANEEKTQGHRYMLRERRHRMSVAMVHC
jgi:hypothetical protein